MLPHSGQRMREVLTSLSLSTPQLQLERKLNCGSGKEDKVPPAERRSRHQAQRLQRSLESIQPNLLILPIRSPRPREGRVLPRDTQQLKTQPKPESQNNGSRLEDFLQSGEKGVSEGHTLLDSWKCRSKKNSHHGPPSPWPGIRIKKQNIQAHSPQQCLPSGTGVKTDSHSVAQSGVQWHDLGSLNLHLPGSSNSLPQPPKPEYSGILAHCNLCLPGSRNSCALPSQVARIADAHCHAWLIFVFLVETRFHHVGQAGFELLTSDDQPTSTSQSAGITGSRVIDLQWVGGPGTQSKGRKKAEQASSALRALPTPPLIKILPAFKPTLAASLRPLLSCPMRFMSPVKDTESRPWGPS
ncbi:hypothetical protein AAY473_006051 [Plecturocebus cupreus]